MSLLHLPLSHFKSLSLSLSTPFLPSPLPLSKPPTFLPPRPLPSPTIKAMRSLQGRVVCATSDKTVSVEVTRLAPHPKYKRRVRKKKKFQAHDPDNKFRVGDFVQLEKCRPISKTKTFLAVPVPPRNAKKEESTELGIPLASDNVVA